MPHEHGTVHEHEVSGFAKTYGLHPLVAFAMFAIDWMMFGSEAATLGASILVTIPVGIALAIPCALVQRHAYKDSWGAAWGKGLIVGLLTAVPSPLPSPLTAGWGVVGLIGLLKKPKAIISDPQVLRASVQLDPHPLPTVRAAPVSRYQAPSEAESVVSHAGGWQPSPHSHERPPSAGYYSEPPPGRLPPAPVRAQEKPVPAHRGLLKIMAIAVALSSGGWYVYQSRYGVFTAAGLTWQKEDSNKFMKWADADQYCKNLMLPGGGWRLPTKNELEALYMSPSSSIVFGHPHDLGRLWSSTADDGLSSNTIFKHLPTHVYDGPADPAISGYAWAIDMNGAMFPEKVTDDMPIMAQCVRP
jgi:hypothetical protein